jgi:hypothetical protein
MGVTIHILSDKGISIQLLLGGGCAISSFNAHSAVRPNVHCVYLANHNNSRHSMFVHRPIVMTEAGAVVSGHQKASQAGASVLRSGGNAIDAAVAASAVLSVAMPHMSGLGGDAIALCFEAATSQTFSINGSGCAP